MTMGESAGRTRGNTVRPSARRRMSNDERAKNTHTKDDPQQWPIKTEPTVGKIAGRILGTVSLFMIANIAFQIGEGLSNILLRTMCVLVVMGCGYLASKTMRWGIVRHL